ncbi:MAG: B12-binding domain-containing radical SAM protein [Dactylosporangium sp.]|nr:B12-binding domain-containing radical SAM protein [Dactylosporangium sp.]
MTPDAGLISGYDPSRRLDLVLVNTPIRDYAQHARNHGFTLPVLGMGYLATYAAVHGLAVGVLDAEAHALPVARVVDLVNGLRPRWVGLNLLSPTYELSARIAAGLSPDIRLMAGGHHAKAMPAEILQDQRMRHLTALVLGEAETRVTELLADHQRRRRLPGVLWREPATGRLLAGDPSGAPHHLAPDVNRLPYLDRRFLAFDPYRAADGRLEANLVGARGCPYDCSFCGAAVSSNPDVTVRIRHINSILGELHHLYRNHQVTAFRFVDDLLLGSRRGMTTLMEGFRSERVGDWAVWDATGRINVLYRCRDRLLDLLVAGGLRELALGIESGSPRVLARLDKRVHPDMTRTVVRRLCERGINVKGYVMLGLPTETVADLDATTRLVRELWYLTDRLPGRFRVSAFEFRPYPGTREWDRLVASGRFDPRRLCRYAAVDLPDCGEDEPLRSRDEFGFSVGVQFGDVPVNEIRRRLASLLREQHHRQDAAFDARTSSS